MKTIIKNICSFVLVTLIVATSTHADDRYLNCMDAFNKKDYASAIPCLREANRKDKKNPKGFFYLGKALLAIDSAEAAVPELIQARELDTANIEVYVLLGDAYVKQNLYSVSIDFYKKAADMDSLNPNYHEKLADAYMKTRQYTEAATAYRRVIARDTSNLEMFKKLGNLLYKAKQYANSLPFLVHYVSRDTNAIEEKYSVVNAMYLTNRFAELIPYGENLLKSDSTKIDVLRMVSYGYVKAKDYANAEISYLKLEQKDTLTAEEYLELAKALKAMEKNDSAIVYYEKAKQKDSTLTAIFYDLGSLYMGKKMYKEAAENFERKIATDTTSGYQFASHLNAGLCLMQLKEYNASLAHIKASLEIRPDYLQGWSSLAACYAQMEDSTAQQRIANQKVIELITTGGEESLEKNKGKLEEAYRVEGIISFTEKNYDRALTNLLKAYQLDPKNCQTNLLIAQCYAVQKKNDDAKKYLCKVLNQCPKNEDAKKLAAFIGVVNGDCK
ncbi:MAG: tetratricopeptide repeat protein [Ignavibacteriae bacterium]|nr:tetratricopeptide repeat protein [Ignavibacteriota bacterium]